MEEYKIKNLIKGWYENKAKRESDSIFKFLCLWICFNAWLGYESKKSRDGEMISWLIKQSPRSSNLMQAYEDASQTKPFQKLVKALANMSPIRDPRGSNRKSIVINDENDRDNIIRAIYKIRCSLFHGGKRVNNSRDEKLIKISTEILNKLIGNLANGW